MKNMINKIKSNLHIILLLFVIAVNLFFAIPRLANYSAVDEHLWTYGRTPRFWKSIENHDWKKTAVNDKPGITVAAISGIGLLFADPMKYKDIIQESKNDDQLEAIRKINFSLRFPVYIFTLLMAPLFFVLLRKLFNKTIALLSVSIIYLSPILLGISIFVNPDSLLWVFSSLSIICFLLLGKTEKSVYAYASGAFLGLALLSKYVSTILYVYFLGLIFLNYIFSKSEVEPRKYLKKASLNYLKMFFSSIATVFVLFPATWIKLNKLLETTIWSRPFEPIWKIFAVFLLVFLVDVFLFKSKFFTLLLDPIKKFRKYLLVLFFSAFLIAVTVVLLDTYGIINTYDFELLLASPKGGGTNTLEFVRLLGGVLTGIYVLLFELSPIVLVSLIFSFFSSLKKDFLNKEETFVTFFLLCFILLYYAGSAFNYIESTVRYQISVYPIAAIMAAIGFYRLANIEKIRKIFSQYNIVLYIFFPIALISSLALIKPFYFSYASNLLPKNYVLNVKDMGDGSYEAAEYLNSLPNAQNLKIWADKVAVCELFTGSCEVHLQADVINENIDYFVVSRGRTEKSISFSSGRLSAEKAAYFRKLYSPESNSELEIMIDGRPNNFIRVIKNELPSS